MSTEKQKLQSHIEANFSLYMDILKWNPEADSSTQLVRAIAESVIQLEDYRVWQLERNGELMSRVLRAQRQVNLLKGLLTSAWILLAATALSLSCHYILTT